MTDLVLHKSEKYISEDLAYYFSDKRDLHGHVRPKKDIYSLTPDSPHLSINFEDGKVGNLFFPFAPFSIDRIYIGISFPLFANNWGTSFLRYLLTRVKAEGCIVLPVYPEMQAAEKNYWSRSLLENIFLSRSRWLGTSNIWAENDGVMSLRVGRKWPPKIKSTAKFLLAQNGNILVRQAITPDLDSDSNTLAENFIRLHQVHWHNVTISAVVEKIIQEHFGMKKGVRLCDIGCENGLLSIESLLSSYINVEKAICHISCNDPLIDYRTIADNFYRSIHGQLTVQPTVLGTLEHSEKFHIVCFVNRLSDFTDSERGVILQKAWEKLMDGGLLIVFENQTEVLNPIDYVVLDRLLSSYGLIIHYSSLVASRLSEDRVITHYSSMLEKELEEENQKKEAVFRVVRKK